tara:strand:+ start:1116 stop:1925 length:810 start_codon:yes stop_codon:yes gene_type:complete
MDIPQPKSSKILVIGDSCIDRYHFGECIRLSPEAPVPIFKLVNTQESQGMAGNVCLNLINLGNKVSLITHNNKITKERFVVTTSNHHIMRLDTGETKKTKPTRLKQNINFKKYDAIVISDYDKGFLDETSINIILKEAAKANVPVFADSKKKDLSCYKDCFLKINENEFESMKREPSNCQFIITLGKRGALYQDRIYESYPSEIDNTGLSPNVCGAGDTFLAAFVTSCLAGEDPPEAIKFANFCASIAVKNFGTYVIREEDVEKWRSSV